MAKVVTDTSARQARPGRPVLLVLGGSLILLVIVAFGLVGWQKTTAPAAPAQTSSQPSSGASSPSTSGVPAGNPSYPAPADPKGGTPANQPKP